MNKLNKYSIYIYAAVIAVFAAVLGVSVVNYMLTKAPAAPAPQPARSNVAMRSQTVVGVTERNLFNIEKQHPVEMLQEAETAVVDNFSGKLTGILLGNTIKDSIVVISTTDGQVYAVSGRGPIDGYTLKDVTLDSAVIDYNGKAYTLHLESGEQSRTTPVTPAATTPPPATNTAPLTSGGSEHIYVERASMMAELADINKVISSLLVAPAYENGEFLGYRVTRMRDDSPVAALGIQRGDLITRIDGQELTNPTALFDMLGKVGEIDAVSVDIVRNNEKKTIFVEVQ